MLRSRNVERGQPRFNFATTKDERPYRARSSNKSTAAFRHSPESSSSPPHLLKSELSAAELSEPGPAALSALRVVESALTEGMIIRAWNIACLKLSRPYYAALLKDININYACGRNAQLSKGFDYSGNSLLVVSIQKQRMRNTAVITGSEQALVDFLIKGSVSIRLSNDDMIVRIVLRVPRRSEAADLALRL